jgi:hypothetical protein
MLKPMKNPPIAQAQKHAMRGFADFGLQPQKRNGPEDHPGRYAD